ncbi:hypothetical protein [Breznakiella homolactica]|uniref:Uncharacterized protein n=1 Tax=Breznakiella homolactica TaxID=2798577 RepID=A0A7T8BC45_9SPIR|nr:hypothetical protein [Breznakiella homolactica]QQO10760.1 hypothetical protein JFL75_07545 [Breznakiella homolactica]
MKKNDKYLTFRRQDIRGKWGIFREAWAAIAGAVTYGTPRGLVPAMLLCRCPVYGGYSAFDGDGYGKHVRKGVLPG